MNYALEQKLDKSRQVLLSVFEYAIENDMDEVTLEDVDDIVLGFKDALIDEYNNMHPHDKTMVQHITNLMLDAYYYKDLKEIPREELFVVTSGRSNDSVAKYRVVLGKSSRFRFDDLTLSMKVSYTEIRDDMDHVHYTSDANRTVLKTIYRDKNGDYYYKKKKQHYTDKNERAYLNEHQLAEMRSFLGRYEQHIKNKQE